MPWGSLVRGFMRVGCKRCLAATVLLLSAVTAVAQDYAVVLMYHRVGDDRFPSTNIRIEQFEAHLDYLDANGFHVMGLPEIMRRLDAGEALPDKAVAITFDDAYESVRDHAHPRLRERDWPYTLFVSADPIDRGVRSYLSWQELRDMRGEGVVFANHSASHAHLTRRLAGEAEAQWRERIAADIERGQDRLVAELGRDAVTTDPKLFAYPYGEYDRDVAELLRSRRYVAFGQHSGVVGPRYDRLALPRFTFNERYAAMEGFRDKINGRPLPVRHVEPWDPVVADGRAPRMVLELAGVEKAAERLQCFFGSRRLAVEARGAGEVVVSAEGDLPPGRSRYNCTLPAPDSGFYWYSHLWLNGKTPAWD